MKKMIRYCLLFIAVVLSGTGIFAQQEVQNSLYMFNPNIINPAYAGSREALSGVMDYRQQWVKWDGAPSTAMLSLHSPLKMESVALGLNIVNDKIGATNNTALYGDFAYRIRLNNRKDRLSFGIRAGGDYYSANLTKLYATDANDQIQMNGNYTRFLFNVGAGVYYYGKKHYIGFAVPKLLQNQKADITSFKAQQLAHYYFVAGYVFKINSMVDFKPSMQLKYTQNAPLSVEANASFFFMEKFWVGAMYRHKAAVGGNIMYQINETFRVGYAYDYTTTTMTKMSPSSHEVMIGFDLRGNKKGFMSPRYF